MNENEGEKAFFCKKMAFVKINVSFLRFKVTYLNA